MIEFHDFSPISLSNTLCIMYTWFIHDIHDVYNDFVELPNLKNVIEVSTQNLKERKIDPLVVDRGCKL